MTGKGARATKDRLFTIAPLERRNSGKKARVTLNIPRKLTARCCSMASALLRSSKERRRRAINGATQAGREAKAWRAYALSKKGGKSCPVDVKHKIDSATFALWRALMLRQFIVADQRQRGNLLNLRTRTLPSFHEKYDALMDRWQKINDELQLDKGTDLARRLMLEKQAKDDGPKPP